LSEILSNHIVSIKTNAMKKDTLIIILLSTALSWITYGHLSKPKCYIPEEEACAPAIGYSFGLLKDLVNDPSLEIPVDIGNRFNNTITKSELTNYETIFDLIPDIDMYENLTYFDTEVTHLIGFEKISQFSDDIQLTEEQKDLIRGLDYSDNYVVISKYKRKTEESGNPEEDYLSYFITIVPETQAQYEGGMDELLSLINRNIHESTEEYTIDGLRPGKVFFTVTSTGDINNIRVVETSGYTSLDEKMVKAIGSLPGKWKPAQNDKGEAIPQELVASFGKMGC
jgi:hypothetical protein